MVIYIFSGQLIRIVSIDSVFLFLYWLIIKFVDVLIWECSFL